MTAAQIDAEVDGVPVLLAPAPGPLRAGLMFRVGVADETAATVGVTHLVEHLALHRLGVADYHYNGLTTATTTQFVTQGSPEAVVSFLHGVCAGLRALPVDRLPVERKLIGSEEAGRGGAANLSMPFWRHGARDYGLISLPPYGIHTLGAEQVAEWAATRFTRGNAVLWLTGTDVPAGLRLELPDGPRHPLPAASSALPLQPAAFPGGASVLVLDALVPRTAAATVYTRALERALFRELRQERGLSYTTATDYSTDGRPTAVVTAVADTRDGDEAAVVEHFAAQLRRLRDTDLDPGELDAVRALALEAVRDPEADARTLPRRATDLLCGFAGRTAAETTDELERVTTADVRDVGRAVHGSALLMLPRGVDMPPAGFEAAPQLSRFSVTGRRFRSRVDPDVALVHAADGVSLSAPPGPLTVLYADCVALLRWPDGARRLLGADGVAVHIEPSFFPLPAQVTAAIEAAVPPGLVVDMPARDPDGIPRLSRITSLRSRVRRARVRLRARVDRSKLLGRGTGGVVTTMLLGLAGAVAVALAVDLRSWPALVAVAVLGVRFWPRRRSR
ncbi:insulinase family protein [Dactylosporangium sp. NPDC050688]|uniref:insulinase family protein n=1 Tax=Dactylosporangium sp. NPDC050688 TaxID=3157217 RepID=UPI0033D1551A